ncbi:MAG: AraC family transcriptional regulator ligand-binding domain-containing protein [Polyangiales bacterium]
MGRPTKEPPIATTLLPAVLRWHGSAGDGDEMSLPLDAIERTLEEIANAHGEPALGLLLPSRIAFTRYGYGELAARASEDVSAALDRLARYASLSTPAATGTREGGSLRIRFPERPRKPARVLHDWSLAHALHTLRESCDAPLRPTRVWLAYPRPRDLGPLHLFFGTTEIDFGAEDDGFTLSPEDLARPLRGRDPRLASTMDDLAAGKLPAESTSFADRVERAIVLPDTSIESVAARLHASARTIQRRLEAEGTRYSEVLDRARASLARKLLREDVTIAEVAARVGFSDVAPFTRAFRRWTGTPPGQFRRAVSRP